MSEQVETNALIEKARSLRESERFGSFLGSISVILAGIDALACITAHNMPGVAACIEGSSLSLAVYSISFSTSEGRKADVIDAELLQRQRPTEIAIPDFEL